MAEPTATGGLAYQPARSPTATPTTQGPVASPGVVPEEDLLAWSASVEGNAAAQDRLGGEPRGAEGLGTDPGGPCDACHEAPPGDPDRGPRDGGVVGTWHGAVIDLELRAGNLYWPELHSQAEAVAYARTIGGAAVVRDEGGTFSVSSLEYTWPFGSFTRAGIGTSGAGAPVSGRSGVVAFVTEDGFVVAPTRCDARDSSLGVGFQHEDLTQPEGASRFQDLIAVRGEGFEEMGGDDEQLLAAFEVAMRLMLLDVLQASEAAAAARPEAFDAEYPRIVTTAEAIDATEVELDTVAQDYLLATDPDEWERRQGPCNHQHAPDRAASPERIAALAERMTALRAQREVLRREYPLFARYDRIAPFLDLSPEDQARAVAEMSGGVLASIEATRGYLERGELELWTLPPLIDATLRAGGFEDPERRTAVLSRAAEAEWDEVVCGAAMGALTVGLGLAAGAATGGMGAALTAAAFTAGAADATWQTGEYLEDLALSGTAEDPAEAVLPADNLTGAVLWLAVAWVGCGIDLAAGAKALKLLQAGVVATLDEALAAVGAGGKTERAVTTARRKGLLEQLVDLAGEEVRRWDPALEPAGGPGVIPDRPDRVAGPVNDDVRRLYPDGWWDEGGKKPDVVAMSGADEWDDPWLTGSAQKTELPPDESEWRSRLAREVDEDHEELPEVWEATKRRAGMARRPRHHVFPQEHRQWFEEHGFVGQWNIDEFTVELDEGTHQALHGGGDWRLGRKWPREWNATVWRTLQAEEAAKGSRLDVDEIFEIVEDLMDQYGIPREYVPYASAG